VFRGGAGNGNSPLPTDPAPAFYPDEELFERERGGKGFVDATVSTRRSGYTALLWTRRAEKRVLFSAAAHPMLRTK
jgi:hypothetical protein